MGVSRRFWGAFGVAVSLAGLAVLYARPVLVVGSAGLGGWLVARQYAFVRTVLAVESDLSATLSPERDRVRVDDEVRVVLAVELASPSPVRIDVRAETPPGLEPTDGSTRVTLAAGDRSAGVAFDVNPPVAGTYRFDPRTATAIGPDGRFDATFPAGTTRTLVVESGGPVDFHVGAGGDALATPYGDRSTSERGRGIDWAEIRSYVAGDEIRRIDWNATARLGEPYVREYETRTRRTTALVLDCRPTMATGPPGAAAFEYARQIALETVATARARAEPIAGFALGEDGLLARHPTTATEEGYTALETELRVLEPTGGDDGRSAYGTSAAEARRYADRLSREDSAFGNRLAPFFGAADPYVERIEGRPLYALARDHLGEVSGAVTAVIVTDDAHPIETREAVKVARRADRHVVVFLTPAVLFEVDGLADLEAAYDRYVAFERFRRELAGLDRVAAFEVGPGERLETLLARDRSRVARAGGGG